MLFIFFLFFVFIFVFCFYVSVQDLWPQLVKKDTIYTKLRKFKRSLDAHIHTLT